MNAWRLHNLAPTRRRSKRESAPTRADLCRPAPAGNDGGVPYAFLAVTVVGAAAVALAYRPIRREPFTVLSFAAGWIAGELAFQNIVWQVIATVLFVYYGALDGWAGWLGLAIAVVGWVGLVGLGIAGLRARHVTTAALAEVRSPSFPVPAEPTAPDLGPLVARHPGHPVQVDGRSRPRRTSTTGATAAAYHRLDVYRSRLAPPQRAPVMVYVHGGAWVIGDKREQGKPMMFELVARGWVCVAINYRLSPKATWPEHIVDVKRALAWVKEHIAEYGGDPSFVAVSGGSAGGHLCALLALSAGDPRFQPGFEEKDTSVQACVPFYGVMDMTSSPRGVPLRDRPGRDAREDRHEGKGVRAPRRVPRRVAHLPGPPRCTPVLRPPGRQRHAGPRRDRPHLRRHVCARCPRQPVAYAELPLAQHAFDVLASLRCQATTVGVGRLPRGGPGRPRGRSSAVMDVTASSKCF